MKIIGAVQSQRNHSQTTQNSSTSLIAKVLGILSLIAIIVIHWIDLPGKLSEVAYLGYGYIVLMVGSALAGILILQNNKRGWQLGAVLALGSIIVYALNRTVGLPLAMDDIGNWTEPLGVYSMIAEAAMVAVSAWVLNRKAVSNSIPTDITKW